MAPPYRADPNPHQRFASFTGHACKASTSREHQLTDRLAQTLLLLPALWQLGRGSADAGHARGENEWWLRMVWRGSGRVQLGFAAIVR